MNNRDQHRSQLWRKKKDQLRTKEIMTREELKEVSEKFEHRVKVGLIVGASVGVALVTASKVFGGGPKRKKTIEVEGKSIDVEDIHYEDEDKTVVVQEAEKKKPIKQAASFGIKALIIEKLMETGIRFISSQLDDLMTPTEKK